MDVAGAVPRGIGASQGRQETLHGLDPKVRSALSVTCAQGWADAISTVVRLLGGFGAWGYKVCLRVPLPSADMSGHGGLIIATGGRDAIGIPC